MRQPFASFTISTKTYTAVLDRLTDETFILVLTKPSVRKPTSACNCDCSWLAWGPRRLTQSHSVPPQTRHAEPAAIELNIKLARPHFSRLESIGVSK